MSRAPQRCKLAWNFLLSVNFTVKITKRKSILSSSKNPMISTNFFENSFAILLQPMMATLYVVLHGMHSAVFRLQKGINYCLLRDAFDWNPTIGNCERHANELLNEVIYQRCGISSSIWLNKRTEGMKNSTTRHFRKSWCCRLNRIQKIQIKKYVRRLSLLAIIRLFL